MTRLLVDYVDTPIGVLAIVADDDGRLRAAGFTDGHVRMERELENGRDTLVRASNPGGLSAAIRAYFEGSLSALDGLPVAASGTAFQETCWRALREIPCGETRTYGDIAVRIGRKGAARAVGLANNKNPVGVVVPCHRVIGSDGSLVGYGGGLERKRWLLAHEATGARTRI